MCLWRHNVSDERVHQEQSELALHCQRCEPQWTEAQPQWYKGGNKPPNQVCLPIRITMAFYTNMSQYNACLKKVCSDHVVTWMVLVEQVLHDYQRRTQTCYSTSRTCREYGTWLKVSKNRQVSAQNWIVGQASRASYGWYWDSQDQWSQSLFRRPHWSWISKSEHC